MEVSESPCNEKTLQIWCKIFFLTNVCVTCQGHNTRIFVKGAVLRSFITTVRWMLRWLERRALPSSKCLLSVVLYRCNCSIIMLLLLTATTCLSTCRGCRGRGEVVQSGKPLKGSSQRLGGCRLWEAWKIPSSLLNTVSGSVCLFCFWNANNSKRFLRKPKVYFRLMTKLRYSLRI